MQSGNRKDMPRINSRNLELLLLLSSAFTSCSNDELSRYLALLCLLSDILLFEGPHPAGNTA